MKNALLDWLDHRTGYRAILHDTLFEHIPGGARWRYVWGSTLAFTFFVQMVTGLILWAAYSASSQTAWESVYYIQHEMTGGWLLRGVHHFTAQAMIVLLAVHLVQVVIDGAYRAPRELNFWLGLLLMQLVLALSLTGYLLPWDQKGYWATKVATNMVALVPFVGESLQRLIVGGSDYGHHTLTRFFALHAGVLPGLLILFLVLHIGLFRRHGIKSKQPHRRPDAPFWPDQVLKDAVACLAVMSVVLILVLWNWPTVDTTMPLGNQLGAELGAPANPAESYSAARPEWYFLFLFQSLKYLQAFPPIFGAIVVPGLVMLSLFLMPFVGRWDLGHRFNVVWTLALLVGAGVLTLLAIRDDHNGQTDHSRHYLEAVADAEHEAHRAIELAGSPTGIPKTGALAMLQNDPQTEGPKLFRQHCASCHDHANRADDAIQTPHTITGENPTGSNLYGFGSQRWVAGLLDPDQIVAAHYFGNTALAEGEMASWVQENIGEAMAPLEGAALAKFRRRVEDVVFALSAEAGLSHQAEPTPEMAKRIAAGRKEIAGEEGFACTDCHKFGEAGELGSAPDLTGYASRAWLLDFIRNPEHERFYPDTNDRMPAFHEGRLSPQELALLVDWLRG